MKDGRYTQYSFEFEKGGGQGNEQNGRAKAANGSNDFGNKCQQKE